MMKNKSKDNVTNKIPNLHVISMALYLCIHFQINQILLKYLLDSRILVLVCC